MIYLFLADGFEEIEALNVVDILRRCGADIKTVGIGSKEIRGAHNIIVTADFDENCIDTNNLEMIILPGGMPGTTNLGKSDTVKKYIEYCDKNDKYIAAICAAPSVLGKYGILDGKPFTCYPGFEDACNGEYTAENVTVCDKIITGKGPGAVFEFAFTLTEILYGSDKVNELKKAMQC